MIIKIGNYINEIGINLMIKRFQDIAYQIIYGKYVNKKFKEIDKVINYNELSEKYGKQIDFLKNFDILYYRITETEATTIIQFLNSGLELVCGVETLPEQNNFY